LVLLALGWIAGKGVARERCKLLLDVATNKDNT